MNKYMAKSFYIVKDKYMLRRFYMMFVGILLIGFSISIFRRTGFGTDPFSAMNIGVSSKLGISFGTYQLIINIIIFLLSIYFARKLMGLGTIFNMVCVGFIADFFTSIYDKYGLILNDLSIRIILMILGVILISFAVSLYFTANLGVAPYDCIALIISDTSNVNFRWCRIATDIICVIIAVICGSIVGLGTIITALGTGPFVQFFNEKFSEPLLNRK